MVMMKYEVAQASEYLVITGRWIKDMKLTLESWVFPGQKCTRMDLLPVNYIFNVQAMSADKLPFIHPTVFTIGPCPDDRNSLLKYAKFMSSHGTNFNHVTELELTMSSHGTNFNHLTELELGLMMSSHVTVLELEFMMSSHDTNFNHVTELMSSHDTNFNHITDLVSGLIEGETRLLAASMTMEEIFKGTKQFKQELFDKVQLELNQFGLLIYKANFKQLVDYFSYLRQKIQMEAANQAKLRDGQTKQKAAKINAETKIVSTQRHGEGKKQEIKIYQNQQRP